MSSTGVGIVFAFSLILALALVHKPLGDYLAWVLTSRRHLGPERVLYRAGGIAADAEQTWGRYLRALLAFSGVSIVFLYAFLRLQHHFWPPFQAPTMSADQSWNTATSFVTNTNWQSYSGESALGYVVQMSGLAVQNFLSAAVGIAVVIALVRGIARANTDRLGNFWVITNEVCPNHSSHAACVAPNAAAVHRHPGNRLPAGGDSNCPDPGFESPGRRLADRESRQHRRVAADWSELQ